MLQVNFTTGSMPLFGLTITDPRGFESSRYEGWVKTMMTILISVL